MRRPRAEDVYQVHVPSDDEMNKWTREVIEGLASGNPRVSKTKVAILNSRVKRDYAYEAVQRKWHSRLGKLATGIFVTWFFGWSIFAVVVLVLLSERIGLEMPSALFIVVGLPIIIFFIGYITTGLIAAADRGHEAFLFRKSVLAIKDHRQWLAIMEDAQARDPESLSPDVRVRWLWRFW